MSNLPPLREVVARHGLAPKKSLGQNFLFDLNLTGKIARAAGPLEGATVLEIGPGPGGLTRALLAHGAAKVLVIERDARCLAALAEIADCYPGRLEVIAGDALTFDYEDWARNAPAGPLRICANLPYNISVALLTRWLTGAHWPPRWDRLTLMFQREVAERIVATPDARAQYGRLSVLCGWRTRAKILFDIAPSAFIPPPKVVSSVVELTPIAPEIFCDLSVLEKATAAAFGQRRKMLRQSLKSLCPSGAIVESVLGSAGIEPTARAEQLSVNDFARLALIFADKMR